MNRIRQFEKKKKVARMEKNKKIKVEKVGNKKKRKKNTDITTNRIN